MKTTGPIQTLMPGLLSLFNLKNLGLQPNRLQDEVQAGIDIEKWCLRGTYENWSTSTSRQIAAAAVNTLAEWTTGAIEVPEGEWWYVERYTISATAAGAGAIADQFACGYQLFGGVNPQHLLGGLETTTATRSASLATATDFWLPPAARLGFWVGTVSTNPVDFAVRGLRFARLVA